MVSYYFIGFMVGIVLGFFSGYLVAWVEFTRRKSKENQRK